MYNMTEYLGYLRSSNADRNNDKPDLDTCLTSLYVVTQYPSHIYAPSNACRFPAFLFKPLIPLGDGSFFSTLGTHQQLDQHLLPAIAADAPTTYQKCPIDR